MLGKSHFYKIVLSLVKTNTQICWACLDDFARFYIKLTVVPSPPLRLALEAAAPLCPPLVRAC